MSLKIDIGRPIVETQAYRVWPKGTSRAPCSLEVPEDIAEDYREACLVLADSPKAAAALARRCLQHVLRDAAKVKCPTLAKEIDAVLESKSLPTHIAENIDAIRHTGNFAAHPEWYEHTGQIVPVEPGEADWTLDVLEGLFDFYYVQPAKSKARRQALDQKLAQAGKSPMKQPQAPGAPPAAQKAPPAGTP